MLDIEMTNSCNQKCSFCPTGISTNPRKKGMMAFETFKTLVDQLYGTEQLQFAGYGEPFLNKDLERCLAYAVENTANKIEIYTNLGATTRERMKDVVKIAPQRMIISLDAMDPETFSRYKRVDQFDQVKENIIILSELMKDSPSKPMQVQVQMVANNYNISQKDQFIEFVESLNFTPRIKTLNTNMSEAPENKIIEYEVKERTRYKTSVYQKKCKWIWGGMIVFWNGDISICCQDPNGYFTHNNILEKPLWEIVNDDEKRTAFRKQYFDNPEQLKICKNCSSA